MLIALLAETAAHGSEHLAEDTPPPFPPFETWHMPSQLFWLAILFGILYLTMSRVDAEIEKNLEAADERIASLRVEAMKNVEQIAIETADTIVGRFGVSASKSELKKAVTAALE